MALFQKDGWLRETLGWTKAFIVDNVRRVHHWLIGGDDDCDHLHCSRCGQCLLDDSSEGCKSCKDALD